MVRSDALEQDYKNRKLWVLQNISKELYLLRKLKEFELSVDIEATLASDEEIKNSSHANS